jgi:hypothetical protein
MPDSVENSSIVDDGVLPHFDDLLKRPVASYNVVTFDAGARVRDTAGQRRPLTPAKRKHPKEGKRYHDSSQYNQIHQVELRKLDGIPDSERAYLETLQGYPQIGQLSTNPSKVIQLRVLYLVIGSC